VVLAACFERGIKLTRFDSSPPTLHEIFVSLAGGSAEDRAMRAMMLIAWRGFVQHATRAPF